MIRMDDAESISFDEERPYSQLIPPKMKFWYQMVPCPGKGYKFSTHWAYLDWKPDALTAILGDVGNWQIVVVVLMMMFNIPSVFHVASPEVTTLYADFWCRKLAKNLTVEQWKTISTVKRTNFRGQEIIDPCYINDLPYESAPYEDLIYMTSAGDLRCTAWDYNDSRLTVVSQFNLACTRLPVNNAAESVFSLGAGLGGLITAFLADRFGRRKVLMLSQGFVVLLGFLIANVTSYSAYLLVRTLMGAACSAVLLGSLILCVEITGGRWQDILCTVYTFSYSLAYMILYLTNKLFDSWIYLQYSITLITIVLLSIWWLVPESPRWLLTVQNIPRLMTVLEMASSFNRRALPPGTSTMMRNMAPMQVEFTKPTMAMLFRGPAIRRMTIVSPFILFFCSLTYFGLVLNQDLFNYGLFFSGLVEFLAGAVVLLMGVRDSVKMVIITNALSGLCCLLAAGLTKSVYLDIVCMAARFFGGMTNSCAQTVIAAMYPTLIRTMALGWGNFFTNMALAVAANVVLLSELSAYLPLFILGLSGLLGSFFFLFFPGKVCRDLLDLPQEVEYGHENIAQQRMKDPEAKPVEPKWKPPPPAETTAPETSMGKASMNKEPSSDHSKKPDKHVITEADNVVGVGETGSVEPDISPKGKMRLSPLKKRAAESRAESSTDKKKRRWYFLFLC